MTDTPSLPIPCPVCDSILTKPECPCGFSLTRPPDPPRELKLFELYEGHPLFI